ncbi:MAG: BtpA/SgcQ family protein [Chloroflexota bacterium]
MWSSHFKQAKVLLPVVHVQSLEQTLRNVAIAREAGCDGVFLINHDTADGKRPFSHQDLVEIATAVNDKFPHFWLGLNCLDLTARETFPYLPDFVNGLWVDNAKIDETTPLQPAADAIQTARVSSEWNGLYFGGVSFKYQRSVTDNAQAAIIATRYMDVVTTSGAGTGTAAAVTKIQKMKQAITPHPLAIASGITPENIHQYLPHADAFLVATGISRSFYELDQHRISLLCQAIRNYRV